MRLRGKQVQTTLLGKTASRSPLRLKLSCSFTLLFADLRSKIFPYSHKVKRTLWRCL
jgi:hypothetical protein